MEKRKIATIILLIIMVLLISFLTYFLMTKVYTINSQLGGFGSSNNLGNDKYKIINNITFERVEVGYEDLNVMCTINVKNNSNKLVKAGRYNIIFLDKNGREIYNRIINIADMRINKEFEIKTKLFKNIVSIYSDFKIEKL